ncbi:MAG: WecB/TagA/CpsF family glycosyltransferase, partial [Chloroflexota bacterium]
RLFLLGAGPGVAEAAGAALRSHYPTLTIAGALAGSPRPCDEAAIGAAIRSARPDILLVAFGAPAQDLWIARNRSALGVPVAIGVGGAFDFLAGRIPRAPGWMRRLGVEWFYRLARQPWRWRRMIALPRFAAMVLVLNVTRGRE